MRTRLNSSDRRASIITAAKTVFARFGFEGAKTQQIAAAAKVSEALLYRHFPSKTALYRAVLRATIEDQERSIAYIGMPQPGARSLVLMLYSLFSDAMMGNQSPNADGIRMLFASLAGDGTFARLVYRRAVRRTMQATQAALQAAIKDGEAHDFGLLTEELIQQLSHVGLMTHAMRMAQKPGSSTPEADAEMLRRSVWFCGLGMGLTPAALTAHYPTSPPERPAAKQTEAPAEKKRKPRKQPAAE